MLSARDVQQLMKLQLVRDVAGRLELTATGRERYRQISGAIAPAAARGNKLSPGEFLQRPALTPRPHRKVGRPGGARRGEYPIARSYSASGIP
jgi:hypothetical protein